MTDLQGIAVLDAQLPLDDPDPALASRSEDHGPSVTWTRIRFDENGYPQLWLEVRHEKNMANLLFYREYVDENNELQSELYSNYNLNGLNDAVRYRTLNKPGTYTVVVVDKDLDKTNYGTVATLEDIDGNGIVDTLTDANQQIYLLDVPNAFSTVTAEDVAAAEAEAAVENEPESETESESEGPSAKVVVVTKNAD